MVDGIGEANPLRYSREYIKLAKHMGEPPVWHVASDDGKHAWCSVRKNNIVAVCMFEYPPQPLCAMCREHQSIRQFTRYF